VATLCGDAVGVDKKIGTRKEDKMEGPKVSLNIRRVTVKVGSESEVILSKRRAQINDMG
jgi:hypothetical protein